MSHNEVIETAVANVASWLFVLTTFHWSALIPPSDRIVEWGIGLLVGLSILTYNVVKTIMLIKNRKHK